MARVIGKGRTPKPCNMATSSASYDSFGLLSPRTRDRSPFGSRW